MPCFVKSNRILTGDEKIIYSEILALIRVGREQQGIKYCYASNTHFAESCGTSVRTVSRAIAKLKKLGFIRVETEFTKPNKSQRRIFSIHPDS